MSWFQGVQISLSLSLSLISTNMGNQCTVLLMISLFLSIVATLLVGDGCWSCSNWVRATQLEIFPGFLCLPHLIIQLNIETWWVLVATSCARQYCYCGHYWWLVVAQSSWSHAVLLRRYTDSCLVNIEEFVLANSAWVCLVNIGRVCPALSLLYINLPCLYLFPDKMD